jgi:hypothetical protein
MKNQFLVLVSIICLTACTNQSDHQHIAESDNISRETRIDTVVMQNIRTGEPVTYIDTTYFETEVKDAIIYVRMSNGKKYELSPFQNTLLVEQKEGEFTRSITVDIPHTEY